MNKAVPWRIKGVPFDARAAAIEAARRSGLSLGEWLNTVIAEQAAADGKDEDDFDLDAKLDAVTARLADLRDRTSDDRTSDDRTSADRDEDVSAAPRRNPRAERRPVARAERAPASRDDRREDRYDDGFEDEAPGSHERMNGRAGMRPRRDGDADTLLENAIAAFDRRANRSSERTARALAQVAELIDTGHRGRERDETALATIADRLNDIERRVAQPVALAPDPTIRDAIVRLEQRLEGLAKQPPAAVAPPAPSPARAKQAAPAEPDGHVHDALARLERRLEMLASRPVADTQDSRPGGDTQSLQPTAAVPQRPAGDASDPRPSMKRPLAAAIAEVARRQKELDEPFAADVPARAVRPPEAVPSALETRLAALVDRIERTAVRKVEAPQAPDVSGLQGNIDALADRIETMRNEIVARQEAEPARADTRTDKGIAEIRREIAAMARAVVDLAPRQTVAALEESVRDLSARVTESRIGGAGEAALAPVEALVRDLAAVVRNSDTKTSITALERSIRSVSAKLEAFDGAAVADHDLARGIADQTREIRDTLARILTQQVPAERIERGIAELSDQVARIAKAGADPRGRGEMAKQMREIRTLLGDPIAQDGALQLLERRLDTIAEKVDAVFGERLDSMLAAQCDARNNAPNVEAMMDDLGQRIDRAVSGGLKAMEQHVARLVEQTGQATPQTSHLEEMVRNLASQIDATAATDASADTLDAMNRQIGELAQHFDRTDKTAESLVVLQETVCDLFARLDHSQTEAVDAAREAAALAVRDLSGGPASLSRDLSDLRALQDAADHRTHSTLTAVHDTLAKVVDRLSSLEDDFAEVRNDAPSVGRPPITASGLAESIARVKASDKPHVRSVERPKAAVVADDDADILIEPGWVFDQRRTAGEIEADGRPQASFIQAARRAAKAAGAVIDGPADHVLPASAPRAASSSARSPAGLDQVRAYYASRKRPILLGLAALMVVAGAFQVAKIATGEPPPATPAAAVQPKTSDRSTARDKTEKTAVVVPAAPTSETKPAAPAPEAMPAPAPARRADAQPTVAPETATGGATIDRAPVGAIARPEQTSDSNGAVRALAVAGDPAAQFELAVRYADGKLLSRDLKLSQQWFEKAAAKGVVPAQYRLGALYERGIGVPKDPVLAKQWYAKAADGGNARAMHNLAVLFADGAGGKPDYAEAISWFRRAADLGVRDSQYNLAILYARGMGTAPNMVDSYVWFAAAAAQGDEDAAKKRDDVAARLPQNDLARAKALFAAFKPKPVNPVANDVTPPPGGWEAMKPPTDGKAGRPKVSNL